MNCPNCGRPLSEKANICPRCKTKIFHNNNASEEKQESTPVSMEGRPLKRKNTVLKDILLILLIIIIVIVLCCILIPDKVVNLIKDVSWMQWLVNLLGR